MTETKKKMDCKKKVIIQSFISCNSYFFFSSEFLEPSPNCEIKPELQGKVRIIR